MADFTDVRSTSRSGHSGAVANLAAPAAELSGLPPDEVRMLRAHCGCVLIWTLRHDEFGPILNGLRRLPAERPEQSGWRDVAVAL